MKIRKIIERILFGVPVYRLPPEPEKGPTELRISSSVEPENYNPNDYFKYLREGLEEAKIIKKKNDKQ